MNVFAWMCGFFGDLALCYLSWRYFIQPKLETYIRRIVREEIAK